MFLGIDPDIILEFNADLSHSSVSESEPIWLLYLGEVGLVDDRLNAASIKAESESLLFPCIFEAITSGRLPGDLIIPLGLDRMCPLEEGLASGIFAILQ